MNLVYKINPKINVDNIKDKYLLVDIISGE